MPYGSSFGGGDYVGFRPFSSLIGGINAGEQMQYNALRSQVARDAMEREQEKRAAVKEFQATGDPRSLTPALTPEQALVAPGQLQLQQLEIGLNASKYFDSIRPDLTWENYPKIRETAMQQFPDLATQHFPPPEQLGDKDAFEKWKWNKIETNARFKAMPQVISAQAKLDAANIAAKAGIDRAGVIAAGRIGAAETSGKYRVQAAETRAKNAATTVKPFTTFIADPEIAKLSPREQVEAYNRSFATTRETPITAEKRVGVENINKAMEELFPGAGGSKTKESAATGQTYQLKNKRTGQMENVTKEQYDLVTGQGK